MKIKKKRRSYRPHHEPKKKYSYLQAGLRRRAEEARRNAKAGVACGCANSVVCAVGGVHWLERAGKLEAVRGDIAVSLLSMQPPALWAAVDQMKVNMTPPATTKSKVKKLKAVVSAKKKTKASASLNGAVSVRDLLGRLLDTARERAADGLCDCAPWDTCRHRIDLHELWSERCETLEDLTVENADVLIPYAKSSGVWAEVDRLSEQRLGPDRSLAPIFKCGDVC